MLRRRVTFSSPTSISEVAEEPLDLSGKEEEEINSGGVTKEDLPPPPPLIPVESVEKTAPGSKMMSQSSKREQLRSNYQVPSSTRIQKSTDIGRISFGAPQQLSPPQMGHALGQQYTPFASSYLPPVLPVNPLSPLLAMNPVGWGSAESQVAAATNALFLQSRLTAAAVRDNLILQHQQQTSRAAQQHLAEYAAIHQQNQLRQQRLVLQQIQQEQQKQLQRQKEKKFEQQLMAFSGTQKRNQWNSISARYSDPGQSNSDSPQTRVSRTSALTSHRIMDQVTPVRKFVFPTLNEQIEAGSPLPLKR